MMKVKKMIYAWLVTSKKDIIQLFIQGQNKLFMNVINLL